MLVAPNGGQVMGAYPKALLAIITSQSVIAILLISLRVRDATLRNKGWKWDLKLAVLSTVLATIHQYVFVLLALLNGLGMPESGLSLHQVQSNLLWSWISIYITLYAVLFAKLAMVAMYLDITQAASRIERMSLWIISILLTITTLVQFVILLTPCNPVEKLWFFELPGKCSGLSRGMAFSYFAGAFFSLIDLILTIYPTTIIIRMQCSRAAKISSCIVIAGGFIPFAACVGKTVYLQEFKKPTDSPRATAGYLLWSITEQWLIIILGSLPPLRAYFGRMMGFDRSSSIQIPGRNALMQKLGRGDLIATAKKRAEWRVQIEEVEDGLTPADDAPLRNRGPADATSSHDSPVG